MLLLEYKRSLLPCFVSQRFCLFSGSFVGGKGLCSEEKAQKHTPFEGLLRSGDTRLCLWHSGDSRYLSGHILLVGHHYVAATAWMKRCVLWDTCQRGKDTINRCVKQRLPSSSLSMACSFMSFCAHTSRPWLLWLTDGQGTGCPGLRGAVRSLSPNHLWGLTPWWGSRGRHHPHCPQGKSAGRDGGAGLGLGSDHRKSEIQGLSTWDTTVNKWWWLTQQ